MLKPLPPKPHEHCCDIAVMVRDNARRKMPAMLVRLWFDGCELTGCEDLEPGELINVEIGGLGEIRARVSKSELGVTSARFIEECPV